MKVILTEYVKSHGKKDDIVEVSDGYATNYLFKQNLAVPYNKENKAKLERKLENKKENMKKENYFKKEIKEELENKEFIFKRKLKNETEIFGSVSSNDIEERLSEYNILKKDIELDESLNQIGTHEVLIKLSSKIKFKIKVTIKG